MEIRPVAPEEMAELGRLTRDAYMALPGHVREPDYEAELADVASRAAVATVLVAVEDGAVLGGVTFVARSDDPMAEHGVDGAASIRMLAVAAEAQGRGVGRALVEACIGRARDLGAPQLVLHSTAWMHAAHRLYERLGFARRPDLDWVPVPDVPLVGYGLDLSPRV